MGSFIGGLVGDRMSHALPYSGRVICAQFTALMGVPFSLILLTAIPQEVSTWLSFAVTLFLMGLTISWVFHSNQWANVCSSGSCKAEGHDHCSAVGGDHVQEMYGYDPKSVSSSGSPREVFALSRGLLCMMAVPFGLCCLLYSPLYLVFKRDTENARLAGLKEDGFAML